MALFRSIAALVLLTAFAPSLAAAKEWKTVRIGVEGTYPPFNYLGADNTLRGFDVDIAKAVCRKQNLRCEFEAQDWEGLIPALVAGKFDAVFASMSITDERRKTVAFSDRYYVSPGLFVATKENAGLGTTPDALRGKRIGAQSATVSARYLAALYAPAGVTVKLYVTQDEANLDLNSGRLDAVLADKVALLPWLQNGGDRCCQVIGPDIRDPRFFGEGIGAAIRKEDRDLKSLIDKGIAAIRADGSYDRINARYFPFSLY